MNDWPALFLLSVLAVNPAGAIAGYQGSMRRVAAAERFPLALIGAGATAFLVLMAAGLADPLREVLDVESSSFRIAAGIALLIAGAQMCWRGHAATPYPGPGWQSAVYPLALPLVVGPGLVGVVMHGATADGAGTGMIVSAALPVAVVTAATAPWVPARLSGFLRAIARLLGAVAVIAAAGLIVNGVQAV